jgi:type III secretion protein R
MTSLEGPSLTSALSLLALAIVPLALVTLTSFSKIAVVLSVLRNALGGGDVPSSVVITALALALTAFVMTPVLEAATHAADGSQDPAAAFKAASEPLRAFLVANVGEREHSLFSTLAKERNPEATGRELSILWPAFALSELSRALQIGFFLYLPFLVLDLVIANVLLALGLTSLTPNLVALPFKLLLFVSVDGVLLLGRALVLGYR